MAKFRRVWVPIKWKRGWKRVGPVKTWRDLIREAMDWGLANEGAIHYLQQRPFDPNKIRDRKLPIYADCSATTTMLYKAAGRPDPNGRNYDGTGYTGTLRRLGTGVHILDAKTGDFIVYGKGTGSHVVVVYEPGPDPLVWSHGQEKGPILVRHSVEVAAHDGYFTCHSGDKV